MIEKPRFILCVCRGDCPGFAKLNVWQFVNFVREQLDVEYVVVHPQLCVGDGENFLNDLLKEGRKDTVYVIGACDPRLQRKLFKESFASKGLDIDKQLTPLDLRNMTTEDAIKKVEETISKIMSNPST